MAIGMNWSYVAGFFDGEGNIHMSFGGRCKTRIAIYQSGERGLVILKEIARFLAEEDMIESRIVTSDRSSKGWKEMHQLAITQRDCVRCFLSWILPYLRIKKVEAQDVLRYFRIYPQLESFDAAKYHTPKGFRKRMAV